MIDEPPFWIVWNPDHPAAPKVTYPTRGAATRAAKAMAERHANEGATFFVLKAQSWHQRQVGMVNCLMADWGVGAPCSMHHERPELVRA